MAAVLACGETAALSHSSAAAHWEIANEQPGPIHVSVLDASRSRNGIEVHRREALTATRHKCIPTTTPAQTLVDIASVWSRSQVEQAIGEAQMRRLIGLERLRSTAADAGRPGAALRAIIDDITFRVTQSELEREFLRLLQRARLPLPETQRRFGRHRVDF